MGAFPFSTLLRTLQGFRFAVQRSQVVMRLEQDVFSGLRFLHARTVWVFRARRHDEKCATAGVLICGLCFLVLHRGPYYFLEINIYILLKEHRSGGMKKVYEYCRGSVGVRLRIYR